MGRKKKEVNNKVIDFQSEEYLKYLIKDPKMSLEVDPENTYEMTNEQKNFIKNYIQFKSIPVAAELSNIKDMNLAKSYFLAYSSQCEIRRINSVLCKIQFAQKMMSIDDIGGYLTSLILDNDVPIADRLKTNDKLKVIKMLIDLHILKAEGTINPKKVEELDLETDIKELSINTIKQLLYTNKQKGKDEKENLIRELNINNLLNAEEIDYLKTLSTKELLQLIEINTKEEDEDESN